MEAIIGYIVIGSVVFIVVLAIGAALHFSTHRSCPFCKTMIPKNASVCPACTRDVEPVWNEEKMRVKHDQRISEIIEQYRNVETTKISGKAAGVLNIVLWVIVAGVVITLIVFIFR